MSVGLGGVVLLVGCGCFSTGLGGGRGNPRFLCMVQVREGVMFWRGWVLYYWWCKCPCFLFL